jgi:hypothetical protein
MQHKIAVLIIAVSIAILTGCASTIVNRNDVVILEWHRAAVSTDIARIIIRRSNRHISGGLVFDTGDDITYDTALDTASGTTTFTCQPLDAKKVGTIVMGTLIYERHPGMMKLEIITPYGQQIFIPEVNVEGGKTYVVKYKGPLNL